MSQKVFRSFREKAGQEEIEGEEERKEKGEEENVPFLLFRRSLFW